MFWFQKIKKEIRASLCPLQPDAGEEEKEKKKNKKKKEEEKEKKEVGDLGAPVDCVAPCAPKWRLREGHRLPSGKVLEGGVAPPGA